MYSQFRESPHVLNVPLLYHHHKIMHFFLLFIQNMILCGANYGSFVITPEPHVPHADESENMVVNVK